jgi:hypothetical protein
MTYKRFIADLFDAHNAIAFARKSYLEVFGVASPATITACQAAIAVAYQLYAAEHGTAQIKVKLANALAFAYVDGIIAGMVRRRFGL